MRAPRVLVSGVVLSQPMGGVRRHNVELLPRVARSLTERGGALAVMEGREGLPFALPPEIERLPSQVASGPPLVRAAQEARALERALAVARDAGRAFDLVHTAHLPAPVRLSSPWTLTLHDLRALDLATTPFARRLLAGSFIGRAVRASAGVITVSESVRERLRALYRLPADKLFVVPNAGDHFDPLPRRAGPEAPVLALGHLEPRKNLALLVRALASDPSLPDLVLAGTAKDDERARLAALAAELGTAERVHFAGPYEDQELPGLLARAGVVALPSRLEGFGIVALEALRARVPLAIADVPALMEVAGEEVPRFAPDDVAGCARALRAALATEPAAIERGAARAAGYSWDRSATAWVAAWDAVAAR